MVAQSSVTFNFSKNGAFFISGVVCSKRARSIEATIRRFRINHCPNNQCLFMVNLFYRIVYTSREVSRTRMNNYVLFLILFFISTAISTVGQYIFLQFPGISLLKSYGLALPFAWVDWLFMTKAIEISHKNKLFTPTQDTFILVITQFVFVLIYNALVFKNKVTRSDIIGFFLILLAFYISFNNVLSKFLGLPYSTKKHSSSHPARDDGDYHPFLSKHHRK